MNAQVKTLLDQVRKLSPEHQLELAEQLLAALDIGADNTGASLLQEVDERWQTFERGDDKGEDAFAAIDELRTELKARKAT